MKSIDASKLGISTHQLSYLIDSWVFSERDRALLKRKLIDNISYEPLAEEFQLSVRQTQAIVYKGLSQIVPHIGIK